MRQETFPESLADTLPPTKPVYEPLNIDNLPERLGYTESDSARKARVDMVKAAIADPNDLIRLDELESEYKQRANEYMNHTPEMIRRIADLGFLIESAKIWREAGIQDGTWRTPHLKERYLEKLFLALEVVGNDDHNGVSRAIKLALREAQADS